MKKVFFLTLIFLAILGCQTPTQKINSPIGDYKIANSSSKQWYIHSDIAKWTEYNAAENYINQFNIIWYTEKSFDLAFLKSSYKSTNYKPMHRIECTYKLRANGKIITKTIYKKTVKALLQPAEKKDLQSYLGAEYSKIPLKVSESALLHMIWLKNGEYQKLYDSSALEHFVSFTEFQTIINQMKNMYGNILWFSAKQESYLENQLGYSLDFNVGYVSTKKPINIHLQWNKNLQLINFAIQSGNKNQTAYAVQLFRQFWTDMQRNDWRKIYDYSSPAFQSDMSYEELTTKAKLLLQSGHVSSFKLSSVELDLSNIGKKWAFFYEKAKGNQWIGINLYQNINTVNYSIDKLVIVE